MNYTPNYGNIVILKIIIKVIIYTRVNFRQDRGNTEKMKIVRFYQGGRGVCTKLPVL